MWLGSRFLDLRGVIWEVARPHLSPSGSKPSMSHPWGQRLGRQMLGQIVKLRPVLEALWFRTDGQRGTAKPVSAENMTARCPTTVCPGRASQGGAPAGCLPSALRPGPPSCPRFLEPTGGPLPSLISLQLISGSRVPTSKSRSPSQRGKGTAGPSL